MWGQVLSSVDLPLSFYSMFIWGPQNRETEEPGTPNSAQRRRCALGLRGTEGGSHQGQEVDRRLLTSRLQDTGHEKVRHRASPPPSLSQGLECPKLALNLLCV